MKVVGSDPDCFKNIGLQTCVVSPVGRHDVVTAAPGLEDYKQKCGKMLNRLF